jgi:hypothetical protein|tara:strand:+ start:104 stop:475 length:372 start_codon:yes stop_codon:yes gene_type:complete
MNKDNIDNTHNIINNITILNKLNLLEENIDKRFVLLEKKINKLLVIFEKDIAKSCSKMSGHINFVENVYDTVKSPLTYICNKVNYITGNDNVTLEDINNEGIIQNREGYTVEDYGYYSDSRGE